MRKLVGLIILTFALGACTNTQKDGKDPDELKEPPQLIRIKGSETARKIINSIDEFYKKTSSAIQVDYSGGGSNLGIMSMMHDEADVIFVSRDLNSEELGFFNQNKFVIDTIAIDGLAIVVNKKNPLKEISMKHLKEIYEGKVLNWKDIGGPNHPIKVYTRESTSGTYSMFKEKVLLNGNCLATHESKSYNEDIVDGVKREDYSIGYLGLGYTMGNDMKVLGLSDTLSKDVVIPDYATLKTGNYPLKRYIMVIYDSKNRKIDNYISCIHNQYTYEKINEAGFIPYKILQ